MSLRQNPKTLESCLTRSGRVKDQFVQLRAPLKTFSSYLRYIGARFLVSRPRLRLKSFVGLALAVVQLGNTTQAEPRSIPIRVGSQPRSIIMDADGNFWSTLSNSSEVIRVTPEGRVTSFATPTQSNPFGITAGPTATSGLRKARLEGSPLSPQLELLRRLDFPPPMPPRG